MTRQYAVYDVFTRKKLAGNPLGVVYDARGLSTEEMQTIAGEFNLSETVFILPAEKPAHTALVRIFTPGGELPFAGHPTVGSAVALAEARAGGQDLDLVMVLEEKVGPVRAVVKLTPGDVSFAEFDLPRNAEEVPIDFDIQAVADALCISASDIGFENHKVSVWSAGVPFAFVPVRDLSVSGQIAFNPMLWQKAAPDKLALFVYCRGGEDHNAHFHARMFSPGMGITEDPATGSAVAALSGAILNFDRLSDGSHSFLIEQGVEMGRPSQIHLHLEIEAGKINRGRIGGHAVKISSGTLHL